MYIEGYTNSKLTDQQVGTCIRFNMEYNAFYNRYRGQLDNTLYEQVYEKLGDFYYVLTSGILDDPNRYDYTVKIKALHEMRDVIGRVFASSQRISNPSILSLMYEVYGILTTI